jgi:hypothetical protein
MRNPVLHLKTPAPVEPAWRGDAECRRTNAVHFFAPAHFERKEEKDLREGQARALCRACRVGSTSSSGDGPCASALQRPSSSRLDPPIGSHP